MNEVENAGREPSIPDDFRLLSVPMPPILPSLTGQNGVSRFFSIYYMGTKATWDTGRLSATFSFRAGYEPLVTHPTVAIDLLNRDLGSDDGPPMHALLCDGEAGRMYVAEWEEVLNFLWRHNPPLSDPAPVDLRRLESAGLGDLRERGVFEFILGATEHQERLCSEMTTWLDAQLTDDLAERLLAAANGGNLSAAWVIIQHRRRTRRDETPPA